MKMYCNNCKKDVTPKNNKCPYCGMNFDLDVVDDVKEIKNREGNKKNKISAIFYLIGVILLVGVFLIFISIMFDSKIGIVDAVSVFIMAMFMFAIAEIIQLLYDIRNKLYEKR